MKKSKMYQLCVFMTVSDELSFARCITENRPSVRFVDLALQAKTDTPAFLRDWEQCSGRLVTMVDSNIVSQADFHRANVVRHPSGKGWVYGMVGAGLVSFLRCVPAPYAEESLLNGELRASVEAGDKVTTDFVEFVMKTARLGGRKVHSVDMESGGVEPKPESKFVAWYDAAERYDGSDGAYLTNHACAWFLAVGSSK